MQFPGSFGPQLSARFPGLPIRGQRHLISRMTLPILTYVAAAGAGSVSRMPFGGPRLLQLLREESEAPQPIAELGK